MAEDKVFKYKGKTVEELKEMSLEDFSLLIPSVLRRKISRGFTEQEQKLLTKFEKKEKKIKTHCRDMFVLPSMVGTKIGIYNGKEFVEIMLVPEMIALRFGELAPSRRIAVHTTMGSKRTVVRK